MTSTLNSTSPSALAYVGDAVLALLVRKRLSSEFVGAKSSVLSKKAAYLCSAVFVFGRVGDVCAVLSADEQAVFRRCANASSGIKAKNASFREYRKASGVEGVLGWLYLQGQQDRVAELVDIIIGKEFDNASK